MPPHFNNEIITVAGVYYRGITPAMPAFKQLTAGTLIFLDRDLANQHDPNAVKCIAADVLGEDIFLGYIPRGIAKRLAPILDRGSDYSCSISQTRSSTGSAIIVITLTTFPCPQLATSPRMTDHDHPMRHAPVISDPQSPTGMRFVQHRDLDRWSRNYDEVPGIYTIWSKDHKIYIGQSSDVGARWRKHFSDLVTKTHHNEELQHDWTHNGGKFFRFDLLEAASTSELDALEKSYIKKFDTWRTGYNKTSDGLGRADHKPTMVQPSPATQPAAENPISLPSPPARILCSDGTCIGVMGSDGRCKECGKPLLAETSVETSTAQTRPKSPPPSDGEGLGWYFVFRCHYIESETKIRLVELICPSEEVFLACFDKRKLVARKTWILTEDDVKYNRHPQGWNAGSLPVGGSWVDCYADVEGTRESFRRNAQGVLETKRKCPTESAVVSPYDKATNAHTIYAEDSNQRDAIWNPNATVNWSLIFTPAFGSYLQMLNWKALGQFDKAESSKNWFNASLAILPIILLMGAFMSDSKAAEGLAFLYLLVWYFSVGRSQGKFVKEKFGSNYPKKPWGKVLFTGIAAIIGYFAFAVVMGLIFGAALSKTESANPFADPNFGADLVGAQNPLSDPDFGKPTEPQANQAATTEQGGYLSDKEVFGEDAAPATLKNKQGATAPQANQPTTTEWLNKARALEEKKDWQGLKDHALQWTKAEPGNSVAWYGLGLAYDDTKQYAKAIEAYRQAIRVSPDYADAWNNLGAANTGTKQYAKAIEAYQQAIRVKPDHVNAWSNLGYTYLNTKQYAKAIEAYQQAIRIKPELAEVWYNLGFAYKYSGQTDKVKEVYERLNAIDTNMADHFFNNVVMPGR